MSHPDAELDKLQELLATLPAEAGPMSVAELDGFLTGVLVCPELIPPSEWLPEVWGSDGAADFGSLEAAQAIIAVVMEHYNRIARTLANAPEEIELVFEVDPNSEDLLWEPWVRGFERAMRLRADSWEQIVDSGDEEAASSVTMMLALHQIDIGTSELTEEAIDELDEMAPDLIPKIVMSLNEWTKARTAGGSRDGPSTGPVRWAGSTKVGRNDPCPCGSGAKFKRCCGGVTVH